MNPPTGLAQAQANAEAQGRWLIVEVTASWAPEQISLSLTADQVAEFGLLVPADLETEASFLRQHQVASVPAVLVLLPAGEVRVARGCITFEQLRDWFVGIRANPGGADAIDWNAAGRLEALTRLMGGGRTEHLLPELIALWSTPDILTIHEKYLSLVPLLELACAASPVVHAHAVLRYS